MIRVADADAEIGLVAAPQWLQAAVDWVNMKRFVDAELELWAIAPEYHGVSGPTGDAPAAVEVCNGKAEGRLYFPTSTELVDEDGVDVPERDAREALIHTLLHEYGHWVQYVRDGCKAGDWRHFSEYERTDDYCAEPWEVFAEGFADEHVEECLAWCNAAAQMIASDPPMMGVLRDWLRSQRA